MRLACLNCLALLIAALNCFGQPSGSLSIVPAPVSVIKKQGNFVINPDTRIVTNTDDEGIRSTIAILKELTGIHLFKEEQSLTGLGKNAIVVRIDNSIVKNEAYRLTVTPDSVVIAAHDGRGVFYAMQTLRQLMPVSIESGKGNNGGILIPAVEINDAPRFSWRGINLDVARHFFSKAFIKKFIDVMALYKYNRLQLHLTDDQGWRIEIKKYPQLVAKGAYRGLDHYLVRELEKYKGPYVKLDTSLIKEIDGKKMYGGYYTQEDMKEIIRYAGDRNIDILPEIDMPSHTGAAMLAFPQLSCNGRGPMCPCNEFSFEFARNVFSEIIALFPFEYIHLGVDEVDKSYWKNSAECEIFMKNNSIDNVDRLQSYFTHQMEAFFNSKGKKIIGWDEILEGGISKTATAMYWRTWIPDNLKNILNYGNTVVLAPTSHTYFDLQQNYRSLKKVYGYTPIPAGTPKDKEDLVLGVQASLWSEVIPTGERVEYMALPRMLAFSDVAWSSESNRDWKDFLARIRSQYKRLDVLNIHYRLPDLSGFIEKNIFVGKGFLTVNQPMKGTVVRYTLDGRAPDSSSTRYTVPVKVTSGTEFTIGYFRPNGELNEVYKADFTEEKTYMKAIDAKPRSKGLIRKYFPGDHQLDAMIRNGDPVAGEPSDGFVIPEQFSRPFSLLYAGYIHIPKTGVYTFYLNSDDGSVLAVDGHTIVDNGGVHKTQLRSGQVALERGYHQLDVSFLEAQGDITLDVDYSYQGGGISEVTSDMLFH